MHVIFAKPNYIIAGIIVILGIGTFAPDQSSAQVALRVHFSYQADNLVPSGYLQRAMPPATPGSNVRISATVYRVNPAGEIAILNPRLYSFRWFHNNNHLASGIGSATTTISVGRRVTASQTILLRLHDARGNFIQDATLDIPISEPIVTVLRQINGASALVELPLITRPGSLLDLRVVPHFVPVASADLLDFVWQIRGETITGPADDPATLRINIPSDALRQPVLYSVTIFTRTARGLEEIARNNFTVTVE